VVSPAAPEGVAHRLQLSRVRLFRDNHRGADMLAQQLPRGGGRVHRELRPAQAGGLEADVK
jgi:hypothetical protein